jgi:hypothetical protein
MRRVEIQDWLETATLPDEEIGHFCFGKSIVLEIAHNNDISNRDQIYGFWTEVTRAAHTYDRLKGVDFNSIHAAERLHSKRLLQQIDRLIPLFDETQFTREFQTYEHILERFRFLALDYPPERGEDRQELFSTSHPFRPRTSYALFREQLNAMRSLVEETQHQFENIRTGRRPNYALGQFVRSMAMFWRDRLGRAITIDQNSPEPYSGAPYFIAECAKRLDKIDSKKITSLIRPYRTDKKAR